jgi:hypothetical protein
VFVFINIPHKRKNIINAFIEMWKESPFLGKERSTSVSQGESSLSSPTLPGLSIQNLIRNMRNGRLTDGFRASPCAWRFSQVTCVISRWRTQIFDTFRIPPFSTI